MNEKGRMFRCAGGATNPFERFVALLTRPKIPFWYFVPTPRSIRARA